MINKILTEVEAQYLKSGAILPFHEYLEIGKRILIVGFISSFFIIFGIHYLLNVQGIILLFSTLFFTILFSLILTLLIGIYPNYIKEIGVKDIEKNLLPSISFMHILSRGGFSIERIIERASETEASEYLCNLYNKFLVNLIVYGNNPQESLRDISARSPSKLFSEFLHGVISTIQTNGALDSFLQFESEKLLRREEQESEKLLNSLGILSEIYVTLLVIAPLLIIIVLTTFSISSGPAISYGILNAVVFLGIPLISLLLIIIIDMKVS